jgi:transcription factor E2F7/8
VLLSYNRKEKSLAELTKKFIERFEGSGSAELVLDQITQEMNVERRRIYDVINIMESLRVVTKIKKNIYKWKGLK